MTSKGDITAILIGMLILIIVAFYTGLFSFPTFTLITQPTYEEQEKMFVDPLVGFDWTPVWTTPLIIIIAVYFLSGIKIIRPTERGAIETLGKFTGFRASGITYTLPFFQKLYRVNVTETLVNVEKQTIITGDNLNATVDAQVYYMVADDTESLQKALYKVRNYETQIVQLAQTTMRNVIGGTQFKEINSNRAKLNKAIFDSIAEQTKNWGINVVRVEIKEISPPENVQETMNQIIIALNQKISAVDFAIARETKAKGEKLAVIQQAIGDKQEKILRAQGEAEAIVLVAQADAERIKLVNTSAQMYFRKEAIILEHLRITESALKDNSKIVITEKGITPTIVLNETAKGIIPLSKPYDRTEGEEKELKDNSIPSDFLGRKKHRSKKTDHIDPNAMEMFQ